MRTVKFFFLAMAMTIATSANAQFVGGGSSKSGSGFGSSSASLDSKAHFTSEFRVGSVAEAGGFGVNLGGQKDIAAFGGCVLAWDFVNFEFAAPFNSPADLDFLALKTGMRFFTPSFANDKIRLYTNLSMGYSVALGETYAVSYYPYFSISNDGMTAKHGFGLTYGLGLQVSKKFNLGYSLQYETACESLSHFATLGWTF